jgi:hypothetical protein
MAASRLMDSLFFIETLAMGYLERVTAFLHYAPSHHGLRLGIPEHAFPACELIVFALKYKNIQKYFYKYEQ